MTLSIFKMLFLFGCLILAQAAPVPRSTSNKSFWSDIFRRLRGPKYSSPSETAIPGIPLVPSLPELDLGPKFDSYDITTSYEQLANPWAYSSDAPFADFDKRNLENASAG